jgi:hypothetical protein
LKEKEDEKNKHLILSYLKKGEKKGRRAKQEIEIRVKSGIHTVKKDSDFSVPSRDVTNQILPGRE